MDRKNFLQSFGLLFGIGILGASEFLESCKKKEDDTSPAPQGPSVNFTLDLSQSANAVLNSNGGSVVSNGVVVVNSSGSFIAVARQCTHEGCNVSYHANNNDFQCPCHGGVYDINGNVVSGPPPAPLKKYSVTKNGNILTISG